MWIIDDVDPYTGVPFGDGFHVMYQVFPGAPGVGQWKTVFICPTKLSAAKILHYLYGVDRIDVGPDLF